MYVKIVKDEKGNSIEYVDHIFYPGDKVYGVTLRINGVTVKETIQQKDIEEYLKKFKMEHNDEKMIREVKENLLDSIKKVKSGDLSSDKAVAISKVANAFTGVLKAEIILDKKHGR